ncbi:MAG: glycoside hydrolase family 66 protein [Phycisphaerales bacterium JB040]
MTRTRLQLLGTLLAGLGAHAADAQQITHATTDKAQHRPGRPVEVLATLRNPTASHWQGTLGVQPTFLGYDIGCVIEQPVSLAPGEETTLAIPLELITPTDRGFLAVLDLADDAGNTLDTSATAFDIADDWTSFPRYGYLTRFGPGEDAEALVGPLADFRINALQFYDWMDSHHVPYTPGLDNWLDLAARPVSRATLLDLIDEAGQRNAASMAYNLMFGAYENYQATSDARYQWGLFNAMPALPSNQDRHPLNVPGWESASLPLFNPADQRWRDFIGGQMATAFDAIPFDGWHIDTLGDRGSLQDETGSPVDLKATYPGFINDMRARLGPDTALVCNVPGSYGEREVAESSDVDAVYQELWGDPMDDEFWDLKQSLADIRSWTDAKPVIAGYVNYEHAKNFSDQNPGFFNGHSVLLADAAILANGGWHIQLGDDLNLLCNEYFPNTNLRATSALLARVRDYYHFAVAYENLLRDRTADTNLRVELGGAPFNDNAGVGGVWTISKARPALGDTSGFTIAHLINLTGAQSTDWRDVNATSTTPTVFSDLSVRVYYSGALADARLWHASPDAGDLRPTRVTDFTTGSDAHGTYVEFALPELRYWTMVWLERRNPGDAGPAQGLSQASPADLNDDGVLDNADIGAFVAFFLSGDPRADFTGDANIDNGDIGAFVAAFLAGC